MRIQPIDQELIIRHQTWLYLLGDEDDEAYEKLVELDIPSAQGLGKMMALFGAPNGETDGSKVSWRYYLAADGLPMAVYDYKGERVCIAIDHRDGLESRRAIAMELHRMLDGTRGMACATTFQYGAVAGVIERYDPDAEEPITYDTSGADQEALAKMLNAE